VAEEVGGTIFSQKLYIRSRANPPPLPGIIPGIKADNHHDGPQKIQTPVLYNSQLKMENELLGMIPGIKVDNHDGPKKFKYLL